MHSAIDDFVAMFAVERGLLRQQQVDAAQEELRVRGLDTPLPLLLVEHGALSYAQVCEVLEAGREALLRAEPGAALAIERWCSGRVAIERGLLDVEQATRRLRTPQAD
ncbi:MAG: hypothetical protein HYZ53_07790, partial [Planctomycetes bacterium]|nr:hypothetical protein [Planctomycetota bacterium]